MISDGSTDNSVTEQEVVYNSYRDLATLQPTLKFFYGVTPKDSQDAAGLKEAIKDSFKKHNMKCVLKKMVFLPSNSISLNRGKN